MLYEKGQRVETYVTWLELSTQFDSSTPQGIQASDHNPAQSAAVM